VTQEVLSSLTTQERTVTIALGGELDLAAVDEMRALFERALAVPEVAAIVVDLTGAEFVDSTALGALVGTHRRAEQQGATFRVVNVQPRVERLLAITGTLTLLTGAGD
jgi:anti-anti-sigma factor